jgi:hypothetical protein
VKRSRLDAGAAIQQKSLCRRRIHAVGNDRSRQAWMVLFRLGDR